MFTYFRSASQRLRSWFASPQRLPIRNKKPHKRLHVEQLEERALLSATNLNSVIDNVLAQFPTANPNPAGTFNFTNSTHPALVPTVIAVGTSVGGGTADLELEDMSLTFSDLAFTGSWTGNVAVTAHSGVLFPGLLDISVADGNDADAFGVVGTINLAQNSGASYLSLDPIDASTIGVPNFFDVNLQDLRLNFTDFRGNDNLNSLHVEFALKGFDTGDDELNAQLRSGNNPFIQLSVEGTASATLDLPAVEIAATNPATFKDALFAETLHRLDGFFGSVTGKLFKVGNIKADFLFRQITVDGRSAGYVAVEGGMSYGGEEWGRSGEFDIAVAISELGPLQFFLSGGPIKTPWGIQIEEVRFASVFNQTIEGFQNTPDAAATAAAAVPAGSSGSRVTLTMSPNQQHDLVRGDRFRILGAPNTAYNGDFTVVDVVGYQVTYEDNQHTPAALGSFSGSANIIRLTIRNPLDLRDAGLRQLFTPPRSMFDWRNQLDQQVMSQLRAGNDVWGSLFGNAVFGGGATISFEGVSDKVMTVAADVAIDTAGGILMNGTLALGGGAAKILASIYADLTKLQSGAAKFLFLADVPKVAVIDPLLVYRGSVGFQPLVGGAPVGLDPSGLPAGVGVNVASATVTGTGPWTATFKLTLPAGTNVSDKFKVGDTLVVVKSNPDKFDGKHIITAIDDTAGTVSFRIGKAVKNGGIDVNLDGVINTDDDGLFNGIPVIDGKLDWDRSGAVDGNDDGGVSLFRLNLATTENLTDYQRVDYRVINGLVDIDNDGDVNADSGDVGVIGTEPGTWVAGSVVANQNALGDGFRITVGGGIDLNIPKATTISLETVTDAVLDFTIPGPGSAIDARIDLSFDGQLREKSVGQIARFAGSFHVTIDSDIPVSSTNPVGGVEIWGAGLLTSDLKSLEKYGLIASASGLLRINSSNTAKEEVLAVANQPSIIIALPAKSFTVRLDGNVDYRIDFDNDKIFEIDESVALFNGIFVLDFSAAQGFNVAIFKENVPGVITPAALQLGPPDASGTRLLTAEALGFLAIRSNGVAAHFYVGLSLQSSQLPLGLAKLSGQAVLVVNTTGQSVSFTVPGGASNPNQPAPGSTLVIPAAAPSDPSAILGAASSATNPQFEALKTGSPTWVAQPTAGPYGVMFIKGNINLLGVLDNEVAGYVLLSKHVVSMEAKYKAERNYLNLASGSVSGRLFYSSQGEFELEAHGDVKLGPDGFNIEGSANLFVSYLDSDGKGSAGVDPKTLVITGDVLFTATLFYIPVAEIGLDVSYSEPNITLTVDVSPVPEIAWTDPDPVFGVSWPYPTFVTKSYSFTIGTLTVEPVKPPPIVLASNTDGALRLNVGPHASARNYNPTEMNEVVNIERLGAGSVSGDKIQITMFGISQEYDNVTSISANLGDGDDFVTIDRGVTVPVVARLGAGADTLTNNTAAFVTAYGEEGPDRLTGGSGTDWLYGGGGSDNIDGGAGADWIEGGADNDFLIGGDGSDNIQGDDGQDLIAGDLGRSTATTAGIDFSSEAAASGGADAIHGGRGADIIFGGSGGDTIHGEGDNDTLLGGDGLATIRSETVGSTIVGSTTVVVSLALGSDGADDFRWTVGDGSDTIDGQLGSDTLNIFGADGSAEPVTVSAKGAGFTAGIGTASLSVDGVEVSNIEGRGGSDTFTINDLTGSVLQKINLKLGSDSVQDAVVVNGSASSDAFTIAPIGNTLRVQRTFGVTIDVLDASSTSGGDTITLDTKAGADTIDVRGTLAGTFTTVNGGDDGDLVHVGSNATPTSNANGNLQGIAGALTVAGGSGVDVLSLDDTGDATANTGGLTSTQITGLGMGSNGITYSGLETLNVNLGSGGDTFNVQGTASGAANTINTGSGNDHVTVQVAGAASGSVINVNTEVDDDVIVVNLAHPSVDATININGGPPSASDAVIVNGTTDSDSITVDGLTVTSGPTIIQLTAVETMTADLLGDADSFIVNGTSIPTFLNGGDGADTYTVNATGLGEPLTLNGQGDTDTYSINLGSLTTAVTVADSGASGSDAVNVNGLAGANHIVLDYATMTSDTELVNYTGVETLQIDTHDAADTFMILDNGAVTTINSGKGDDEFTIGPALNEDGEVIDANGSGTNADELAIKGTSFQMTINGGDDNDDFEVNRNTGELFLNGENGNDVFVINTLITGGDSTVDSGGGADLITYLQNAPVHINGGDGFDIIIVNGSKLDDTFIITGTTIEVVGSRLVDYTGIESLQANGRKGNDTFYVDTTTDHAGKPVASTELQLLAVNGQQDSDLVYLTPSDLGTEFFIRGGDPHTPMQRDQLPGDALYLDFTGLTAEERLGVRLNATGANDPTDPVFNVWNIPGHGGVNYKQIEKLNHVQTLAAAADLGGNEPRVNVIDAETGLQKLSFLAFDTGFKGGVRVAVGDVNGDAIPDIITSAGPGGGPQVRVFNGATGARFTEPIGDFFAFPAGSKTSVFVAVGDINLDGLADIVTGSDSGGEPIVTVFDAYKLLTGQGNPVVSQFFAYDRHFSGGVRLAIGDLTGDGAPDIVTGPGSGLNSEVRIFATSLSADQATVTHSLLTSFSAFPNYNGGVNLAVGDITGDGRADIVVGTASGGTSLVRIYDGATISSGPAPTLLVEFAPYGKQAGGVRVALVDVDGDGDNELITASTLVGSKAKPKCFDFLPDGLGGLTPTAIDDFFAGYASDPFFEGALFLAGGN